MRSMKGSVNVNWLGKFTVCIGRRTDLSLMSCTKERQSSETWWVFPTNCLVVSGFFKQTHNYWEKTLQRGILQGLSPIDGAIIYTSLSFCRHAKTQSIKKGYLSESSCYLSLVTWANTSHLPLCYAIKTSEKKAWGMLQLNYATALPVRAIYHHDEQQKHWTMLKRPVHEVLDHFWNSNAKTFGHRF